MSKGDQVKIDGMLSSWVNGIEGVQFADGTMLSRAQLVNLETTGTTGNDVLYGTNGDEVFDGKGGGDVESGSGGNDTYILAPGSGALTIANGSHLDNAASGDLSINNVNPEDVWLQQVGDNLEVSIMGTSTTATVENWFNNSFSQLDEVTVNGGKPDARCAAQSTSSSNGDLPIGAPWV